MKLKRLSNMRSLCKEEPTPEDELFRQLFSENSVLDVLPEVNMEQNSLAHDNTNHNILQPMQITEYLTNITNESNTSTTSSVVCFNQVNPPINSQLYLPSPLMVLNLAGHSGDSQFCVKVPKVCGKYKWTFSTKLYKLYAGRNVSFPMKVFFPPERNLSVVICPVFESTGLRFTPVRRCINCSLSDKSPVKEHLLRVDGTNCHYLMDNDRAVIEVPLRNQSLEDESAMTLLLRMTCRTSCLGGPNRNHFALLFTLLDENRQKIASDVQHVKCCESPFRDLKNDLEYARKQETTSRQQIAVISSSQEIKRPTKRKLKIKTEAECVPLMIPKKYEKKVRKYVNLLHYREKAGKSVKYFSATDTE